MVTNLGESRNVFICQLEGGNGSSGTVHEQLYSLVLTQCGDRRKIFNIWYSQGGNAVGRLPGDAQCFTTASKNTNVRRGLQDLLCQAGAGIDKMFTVVQDNEHFLRTQVIAQHIDDWALRLIPQANRNRGGAWHK